MYLSYWNLVEEPFRNIADARFTFLGDQHREGLARLVYSVDRRKIGGVLVGPYGIGKSMILELLGMRLTDKKDIQFIKMDCPPSGAADLARQIAYRLGHRTPIVQPYDVLNIIEEKFTAGPCRHLVLALDEAQFLHQSADREFLHLITNVRVRTPSGTAGENAVTLILAGHERLIPFLAEDEAMAQRFQFFWKLAALNLAQTTEYVHVRIRAAGGDIWVFEEDSLPVLQDASRGIPRLINNICDVALLLGCAEHSTKITRDLMRRAIEESKSPLFEGKGGGLGVAQERNHE